MTRFGILFLICLSVLIVSCESLRRGAVRLLSLEKYSPGPVPSEASGVSAIEVPDDKTQALKLEMVAGGFDGITDVQFLPGENFRAVVLQKNGDACRLRSHKIFKKNRMDSNRRLWVVDIRKRCAPSTFH